MLDVSGRYVLLFNGEIYNYRELAETYFSEERSLNRSSDSAVLLAMYRQFGPKCVEHLNGMFAFAIIDLFTRCVFLARDRFGEKPLYWMQSGGVFAFASELGSLKRLMPDHDWSVDRDALLLYHVIGSVPAPYTIYRGVRALRAASWLRADSGGAIIEETYWAPGSGNYPQPQDRREAVEGCRTLVLDAVRSRMVSDVPVGLFLSGGLDSGSILSLMVSLGTRDPAALCIDFPEGEYSEAKLAVQSASKFGARLYRAVVSRQDFEGTLENFFCSADQPTTDGFNTYFVSLHAKQLGIKVWLSGVGGDEVFGGYPSFRRIPLLSRLSSVLQRASALSFGLGRIIEVASPYCYRWGRIANLGIAGEPAVRAYQYLRNTIPPRLAVRLLSADTRQKGDEALRLVDGVYPKTAVCADDFQRASMLEATVYMASQLLRDIDNFSMAHSVEVRAPFLDHRLFEYVFALPSRFKTGTRQAKALLVDALPTGLSSSLLRQPKRGFAFPLAVWLRNGLNPSFEDCVFQARNAEFWDMTAVRGVWSTYLAGRIHWSVPWQFYAFARWYQAHHA
jgi:asparagine synthase (glutamine-hydrolysing)